MITSHFWNAVLKTWIDLNYHDPSVPVPTLLWNNSHIKGLVKAVFVCNGTLKIDLIMKV